MRFVILFMLLSLLSGCAGKVLMRDCEPDFQKCRSGEQCEQYYMCDRA